MNLLFKSTLNHINNVTIIRHLLLLEKEPRELRLEMLRLERTSKHTMKLKPNKMWMGSIKMVLGIYFSSKYKTTSYWILNTLNLTILEKLPLKSHLTITIKGDGQAETSIIKILPCSTTNIGSLLRQPLLQVYWSSFEGILASIAKQ